MSDNQGSTVFTDLLSTNKTNTVIINNKQEQRISLLVSFSIDSH
jgi:hypothetical protein